jgi:glycerol-3-phosphate dehydrogenase
MGLDYEQWKLVREALAERKYVLITLPWPVLSSCRTFLHIAPYLSFALPIALPVVRPRSFRDDLSHGSSTNGGKCPTSGCVRSIPTLSRHSRHLQVGVKMYDFLAGKANLQSSYFLSKAKTLDEFPLLKPEKLAGSLVYYDGCAVLPDLTSQPVSWGAQATQRRADGPCAMRDVPSCCRVTIRRCSR